MKNLKNSHDDVAPWKVWAAVILVLVLAISGGYYLWQEENKAGLVPLFEQIEKK